MSEFVVYTVLTGNYDDILQPAVVDSRFDYVLFSNDLAGQIGVWVVNPIPDVIPGDNKRLSRFPKTHPESLLTEYKASLYIDANIQILDQWVYDRFVELYNRQVEYAGIKLVLTGRDCIYEHAFDLIQWLVEYDSVALNQCNQLHKLGFPRHFGLNENNIIFRIHTERMRRADEEWWNWIVNYSSRDQLSFMYCLWKYNVPIHYFLPEGEDARNGHHFLLIEHNGRTIVRKSKTIKPGLIRKLYRKSNSFNQEKSLNNWLAICESKYPQTRLVFDRIKTVTISIPQLINSIVKR